MPKKVVFCQNHPEERARAQGLCGKCYQFAKRHGTIQNVHFPVDPNGVCSRCGDTPIHCKGVCEPCYKAARMAGVRANPETNEALLVYQRMHNKRSYNKRMSREAADPEFQEAERAKRRAGMRKWKYNITEEEREALIVSQGNACGICATAFVFGQPHHRHRPCTDHDPVDEIVRGILCMDCNLGLGNLDDNTQRIDSAISYLWRPYPIVIHPNRRDVSGNGTCSNHPDRRAASRGLCEACYQQLRKHPDYVPAVKPDMSLPCRRCSNTPLFGLGLCERCYRNDTGSISNYGIDTDEKRRLIATQFNTCLVCLRAFGAGRRQPCVDHDSAAPKHRCIRGILCDGCNVALGNFKHSTMLLLSAKVYLLAYEERYLSVCQAT